ncbi:MAG: hypothetical protein CMB80_08775 [Flammeovirgaceae bacterium]|nr:hypothetical protein [Flammeovirgaceae bacterium]|tara:strand:+ start:3459 stop:3764 length:306 start_codon:yes stop_codon:yes gene_type:complete
MGNALRVPDHNLDAPEIVSFELEQFSPENVFTGPNFSTTVYGKEITLSDVAEEAVEKADTNCYAVYELIAKGKTDDAVKLVLADMEKANGDLIHNRWLEVN